MAAHGVLQWLRLLARATGPARPDHELVSRFVEADDQAAFTILVQRHGPMVYGVCQRLLAQGQDAEDAFQATFLVFARKAQSIRKQASVSCWLYGVASRIALNLRRKTARERRQEWAAPPVTEAEVSWRDVRGVLDEELAKLPERLRLPVVLCYLDGKTRDEAAQELGLNESTLRGRLERGRDLLRGRLTSRGVTLSAALLASLLSANAASALPAALLASTVHAAGKPLAGVVSANVIGLVLMEVNAMFVSKLIHVALVVCVAALVLGGVAAGTGALLREEQAKEAPAAQKKGEFPKPAEHDDFIHGEVGKTISFPGDNEEMPKVNAYRLRNAGGNGIPKGTTVIIAIRKETRIEQMDGKARKKIEPDKDNPSPPYLPFRATISIERTSAEKIKKEGETWWIEPTAILILKEAERGIPVLLAADEIKPAHGDDELRKLLIEKHNAGAREVETLNAMIMAGKIVYSDANNLNDVIGAIQRFTETKLELAVDPAERIAVRRRCVDATEEVEIECHYMWRAGKLNGDRYQRCVQARAEAEIQLLKEQRRAK